MKPSLYMSVQSCIVTNIDTSIQVYLLKRRFLRGKCNIHLIGLYVISLEVSRKVRVYIGVVLVFLFMFVNEIQNLQRRVGIFLGFSGLLYFLLRHFT